MHTAMCACVCVCGGGGGETLLPRAVLRMFRLQAGGRRFFWRTPANKDAPGKGLIGVNYLLWRTWMASSFSELFQFNRLCGSRSLPLQIRNRRQGQVRGRIAQVCVRPSAFQALLCKIQGAVSLQPVHHAMPAFMLMASVLGGACRLASRKAQAGHATGSPQSS